MLPDKTRSYCLTSVLAIALACSAGHACAQEVTITQPSPNGTTQVFTAVETEPVPVGGMSAFYRFLANKIRYPSPDKIYNIQGRVIVTFVVEKDGSLSDMKIIRSPSNTLAEETIRVLKLSTNWSPGLQNNVPVRVQYTIPVNYSLGGGNDDQIFSGLMSFLNNSANYPDALKNNSGAGLVVMDINFVKNHISDVHISKGVSDELNKALTNLVLLYDNEVKVRNGSYSLIFKFGYDAINTSELNGYAKPDMVIGTVEIKPTKK